VESDTVRFLKHVVWGLIHPHSSSSSSSCLLHRVQKINNLLLCSPSSNNILFVWPSPGQTLPAYRDRPGSRPLRQSVSQPHHPHAPFLSFPPTSSSPPIPLLPKSVTLASDNSAKVSSLLVPRAISFPPEVGTGQQRLSPNSMSQSKQGRRRRSSSLIYQEPPESIEHTSDQAALPNLNANWVNAKGE